MRRRCRKPRQALALVASLTLCPLVAPTSYGNVNTWLPAAGGSWSVSGNWSDALPTADDDVSNLLPASPITVNTTTAFNTFLSQSSDLTVTGGNLHGSQPASASTAQINGLLTVNNGTLSNLTLLPGTGPAATFTSHGGNAIDSVVLAAPVSFAGAAYSRVYNTNTLSGTLNFSGTSQGLQFHDGSAKLIVTSAGSVLGHGATYNFFGGGTLENHGTVSANVAGQTLSLGQTNTTADGTFSALNGGLLNFTSALAGTGAGFSVNVDSANGSSATIHNGSLSGTYASSTGTGLSFSSHGGNAINTASIGGTLTFNADAYSRLYNANTLTGRIDFAGTSQGIQFHDASALLTVAPSGVIRGHGATYNFFGGGTVANNGLISADTAGSSLTLGHTNTTGAGTFEAKNGGTLILTTRLVGGGATVLADTGTVLVSNGTLSGTFAAATGSGVSFSSHGNNAIDAATVNGNLTFANDAYSRVYNTNTLSGTLNFSGISNGLQFHDGSALLTVAPAGVVRGFGATYNFFNGGTLTNNGLVSADTAGYSLTLGHSNTTGSGTFEAKNGGTLILTTRLVGGGATVLADTGTVLVSNGTLSGTFAAATGSGVSFSSHGNNAIDAATVNGNLTFGPDGYTRAYNANTVSGTIAMSGIANGIQFHNNAASLAVTPTGSIRGYGNLYNFFTGGTLTVDGVASADVAATTLSFAQSNMNGSGTLQAINGGTLAISSNFTSNSAAINTDADPASTVLLHAGTLRGTVGSSTGKGLSLSSHGANALDAATIAQPARLTLPEAGYARLYNANVIDGTLDMASTSQGLQFHNSAASLTISPTGTARGYGTFSNYFTGGTLTNQGTLSADTPAQALAVNNSNFTNSGSITVSPGATLSISNSTAFTQTSSGTTLVNGTITRPGGTLSIPAGTILGDGTVASPLSMTGGTLSPGAAVGTLHLSSTYSQSSTSTLSIELGGYTQGVTYDLLQVTGSASLAGALNISLVDGFVPNFFDSFTILTASSRTGTFPIRNSIPGLTYALTYLPDRVKVTFVPLPGDADVDGDVDLDDQGIWASNFTGSLEPGTGTAHFTQGDFDVDGDVDLDDQGIWAGTFTGSLAPSALAAVPEPSSILAACALAIPSLLNRRRRRPTPPPTTKRS